MSSRCHRCYKPLQPGEHFRIRGKDFILCEDCASEKYTQCEDCGEYVCENDLILADSKYVCLWCLVEKYALCPHCTEYFPIAKMVDFHGHLMCAGCKREYFTKCGQCGKAVETDELEEITFKNGKTISVCPKCLKEKFRYCAVCGELFPKEKLAAVNGELLCKDCLQDLAASGSDSLINTAAAAAGIYAGLKAAEWVSGSQNNSTTIELTEDDIYPDDGLGSE